MKSQIYGILGMMYVLAIGILIVIAAYGTTKQFYYQSAAPLYKLDLYSVSSAVQKLVMMYNQERAYAVSKSLFFAGVYGGYTPKQMIVIANASACGGCKQGYKVDGIKCVATSSSTSPKEYTPTCYKGWNGYIDVGNIPLKYYSILPVKKVVYWKNGDKNLVPTFDEFKKTIIYDAGNFFSQPDPALRAALYLLSNSLPNMRYNLSITINGNDITARWIPLGTSTFIVSYPSSENPAVQYMFRLSVMNNINNIDIKTLFDFASNLASKYTAPLSNPSSSPLPVILDQAYIYSNDVNGATYYCNYSLSDTPFDNQLCSKDKSAVKQVYMGPIKELIYYETKGNNYKFEQNSICYTLNEESYLWKSFDFSEPNSISGTICGVEIEPNVVNGKIVLDIKGFYGWCAKGNSYSAAKEGLMYSMCIVTKKLENKLNAYATSKDIVAKVIPLSDFNLSLSSVSSGDFSWDINSFEYTIKTDFCYSNFVSQDNDHYQIYSKSICLYNGFNNVKKVSESSSVGTCYDMKDKFIFWNKVPSSSGSDFYVTKLLCVTKDGVTEHSLPQQVKGANVPIKSDSAKMEYYIFSELANKGYIDKKNYYYLNAFCKVVNSQSPTEIEVTTSDYRYTLSNLQVILSKSASKTGDYIDKVRCLTSSGSTSDINTNLYWNAWGYDETYLDNHDVWDANFDASGGSKWFDIFCIVHGYSSAKEVHYSYTDGKRYKSPELKATISKETAYSMIVDKVKCGNTWYDLSGNYNNIVGNNYISVGNYIYYSFFNPIKIDSKLIEYPIISRYAIKVCGSASPFFYYTTSSDNAYYILDIGGNGNTGYDYKAEITCGMGTE